MVARRFVSVLFLCVLVLVTIALCSQFLFPTHVLLGGPDIDIPHGYRPYSCSRLDHSTFSLPLNASSLFFVAPRRRSFGRLTAHSADDPSSDTLTVHVSHSSSKLSHPAACLLSRPHRDVYGIALLTRNPFRWPWRPLPPPTAFNVDLVFPISDSTIHVRKFKTNLPNFSQSFFDLDSIHFQSFQVTSTRKSIFVQSVNADRAFIHTSNMSISGTFNVSSVLVLHTSNAPVDATVKVYQNASKRSHVALSTSNAPINSTISLYANTELTKESRFGLAAHTTNGCLSLSLPEIPVDSAVHLAASTSNNLAHVSLHPAYEGRFKLRTFDGPARLEVDHDVKDPAGRGRERSIVEHQHRSGRCSANEHDDDDDDDDDDDEDEDEDDERHAAFGSEESYFGGSIDQLPLGVTRDDTDRRDGTALFSPKHRCKVLSGNVFWSEEGKCRGSIRLKTSRAPVVLSL